MKTTILISQHPAEISWVKSKMHVDEVFDHFTNEDVSSLTPDHTVIGSLPIRLAGAVCEKGTRYILLCINTPPELHEQELTVEQLDQLGSRLEECRVVRA
jgi:CRISPR-associated protein Csx16